MIAIFVSSTFRDMQAERDLLAKKVLPVIDEYARRRGETVSFIDLRWGINTSSSKSEEESMRKILSVCLKEIEDAQPSFIAFIGERYGTIPEKELIANAIETGEDKDFRLDDMKKSITELEIEYGAFSKKGQPERCLFYFREPLPRELMGDKEKEAYLSEDEEHRTKLENLKNNLVNKAESSVRSYTCEWDPVNRCVSDLDELEEKLIKDLKTLLDDRLGEEKQLSWQERELRDAWLYLGQKARLGTARQEDFRAYASSLSEDDTKLLIIQDVRGSGKSTAMGSVAVMLKEMGAEVMPFACGMSAGSSSAFDIVKQGVYFMEGLLGRQEHFGSAGPDGKEKSFEDWKKAWEELLYEHSRDEGSRVAFVIDAMDQLIKDDVTENMLWLPALPKGVTIATSCLDTFKLPVVIELRDKLRKESLREMSAPDRRNVLLALDKLNHKELSDELKDKLIGLPASSNPLYLSMLYQRFVMMDSDDFKSIEEIKQKDKTGGYLMGLVEDAPKDVDGVCAMLLDEAASRINKEQSDYILRLLAASGNGLRESDIRAIFDREGLKYSVLDYSQLRLYMRPYFGELGDGRTDYVHESIRQGLLKKMNMNPEDRERINLALYKHLESLPDSDPVHREEYVRFAHLCDKKEELVRRIEGYSQEDLRYVAKGLREVCLEDKGAWLCSVIDRNIETGNMSHKYIEFLNRDLYNSFLLSMHNMGILEGILRRNAAQAKVLNAMEGGPRSLRDLGLTHIMVASTKKQQGKLEEALELFGEALSMFEQLARDFGTPEDLISLGSTYGDIAIIKWKQDKLDEALEFNERELPIFEQLAEEIGTPNILRELGVTYVSMAGVREKQGKIEEAVELFEKALNIHERLAKETQTILSLSDLGATNGRIAVIKGEQGEINEALRFHGRELQIFTLLAKKVGTPDILRDLAVAYKSIAGVMKQQGKLDDALGFLCNALLVSELLYRQMGTPRSIIDLSLIYAGIASVMQTQGKLEEALERCERGIQLMEPLVKGIVQPDGYIVLSAIYATIASIKHEQGKLVEAREISSKALGIRESLIKEASTPLNKSLLSSIYFEMACIKELQGKYEEALQLHGRAREIQENLMEQIHTPYIYMELSNTYVCIAGIKERQDKLDDALELYNKALSIQEKDSKEIQLPAISRNVSLIYITIAGIKNLKREFDEALELCEKVLPVFVGLDKKMGTPQSLRDLMATYSMKANIKEAQMQLEEALELYGNALQICEHLVNWVGTPESLYDISIVYGRIAGIKIAQCKLDGATEMYWKCLEIGIRLVKEVGTPDSLRQLSATYYNLAIIKEKQGKLAKALELYGKALDTFEDLIKKTEQVNDVRILITELLKISAKYKHLSKEEEASSCLAKAFKLVKRLHCEDPTSQKDDVMYEKIKQMVENESR